jgi:hypothetical protein
VNRIEIIEPRWHDRTLLVATWKVGEDNQIAVKHKDFPEPFYMVGEQLKKYPTQTIATKNGQQASMYVVPINDLSTDLNIKGL